jgi:hypothetical protein
VADMTIEVTAVVVLGLFTLAILITIYAHKKGWLNA